MRTNKHNIEKRANHLISSSFLQWISVIGQYIYLFWFYINKSIVEIIQKRISSVLGTIYGMFVLEGHTIFRAAWYTLVKYRNDPITYGFNQFNERNCLNRPVLLLHGAVGSWRYLGDLAMTLKNADRPVFVLNLGFGLPSTEMRRKIFSKIEEIQSQYSNLKQKIDVQSTNNKNKGQTLYTILEESSTIKRFTTISHQSNSNHIPLIDIVAHSNGGNIALYSTFTEDCSYIDKESYLKFRSTTLQAHLYIGKIITVALPSNQIETNWMREINKFNDLYNINARFDALMSYKKCALEKELPTHVDYIDEGHIGVVFNRDTHNRILHFLSVYRKLLPK